MRRSFLALLVLILPAVIMASGDRNERIELNNHFRIQYHQKTLDGHPDHFGAFTLFQAQSRNATHVRAYVYTFDEAAGNFYHAGQFKDFPIAQWNSPQDYDAGDQLHSTTERVRIQNGRFQFLDKPFNQQGIRGEWRSLLAEAFEGSPAYCPTEVEGFLDAVESHTVSTTSSASADLRAESAPDVTAASYADRFYFVRDLPGYSANTLVDVRVGGDGQLQFRTMSMAPNSANSNVPSDFQDDVTRVRWPSAEGDQVEWINVTQEQLERNFVAANVTYRESNGQAALLAQHPTNSGRRDLIVSSRSTQTTFTPPAPGQVRQEPQRQPAQQQAAQGGGNGVGSSSGESDLNIPAELRERWAAGRYNSDFQSPAEAQLFLRYLLENIDDLEALGNEDVTTRAERGRPPLEAGDLNPWGGVSGNYQKRITRAVGHHTVMDEDACIENVENAHEAGRGWDAPGYHWVICTDGRVYEGRPLSFAGAHAGSDSNGRSNNYDSLGIAFIGNFEAYDAVREPMGRRGPLTSPSEAQLVAWVRLQIALQSRNSEILADLPDDVTLDIQRIQGHQHAKATSCPGAGCLPLINLTHQAMYPNSEQDPDD